MTYLTAAIEIFRFIKRYRSREESRWQREADERASERAHQRAMLETIFGKMVESQKVQSEGLMSIAEAQQAQARVMQTWLDGFKIQDPSPQAPQVARPNDEIEWVKEQLQLASQGLGDLDLSNLPPEFKLAFELSQMGADPNGDFDREGSDFQ